MADLPEISSPSGTFEHLSWLKEHHYIVGLSDYEGQSERLKFFQFLACDQFLRCQVEDVYQFLYNLPSIHVISDSLYRKLSGLDIDSQEYKELKTHLTGFFSDLLEATPTHQLNIRQALNSNTQAVLNGPRSIHQSDPDILFTELLNCYQSVQDLPSNVRRDFFVQKTIDPEFVFTRDGKIFDAQAYQAQFSQPENGVYPTIPWGAQVTYDPIADSAILRVVWGDNRGATLGDSQADVHVISFRKDDSFDVALGVNPDKSMAFREGEGAIMKYELPEHLKAVSPAQRLHIEHAAVLIRLAYQRLAYTHGESMVPGLKMELSSGQYSEPVVTELCFWTPPKESELEFMEKRTERGLTISAHINHPDWLNVDGQNTPKFLSKVDLSKKPILPIMIYIGPKITSSDQMTNLTVEGIRKWIELNHISDREIIIIAPGSDVSHQGKLITELMNSENGYKIRYFTVGDRFMFRKGDKVRIVKSEYGLAFHNDSQGGWGSIRCLQQTHPIKRLMPEAVGSKSYRLNELSNLPLTFQLSTRFFVESLKASGVHDLWQSLSTQEYTSEEDMITKFSEIRNKLTKLDAVWFKKLMTLMRRNTRNFKSQLWAVRSSSIIEDGGIESAQGKYSKKRSSYAGQFETYHNIESTDLEKAILDVMKSLFSDDVARSIYRLEQPSRSHRLSGLLMSVIVQEQINCDISGVAFGKVGRSKEEIKIAFQPGIAGITKEDKSKPRFELVYDRNGNLKYIKISDPQKTEDIYFYSIDKFYKFKYGIFPINIFEPALNDLLRCLLHARSEGKYLDIEWGIGRSARVGRRRSGSRKLYKFQVRDQK